MRRREADIVPITIRQTAEVTPVTGLATREFLGVEVSASEYREICRNLTQYFDLLKTWADREKDEKIKESPANPAD